MQSCGLRCELLDTQPMSKAVDCVIMMQGAKGFQKLVMPLLLASMPLLLATMVVECGCLNGTCSLKSFNGIHDFVRLLGSTLCA